jgi:hypothetical protein
MRFSEDEAGVEVGEERGERREEGVGRERIARRD